MENSPNTGGPPRQQKPGSLIKTPRFVLGETLMRKCFLHIGTHKTATTSIQRVLFSHARDLEIDGFLYPAVGRPDDAPAGHHNLAWEISGDRRFRSDFGTAGDLVRELATTSRDIIISSEDFESSAYHCDRFESFLDAIQKLGIEMSLVIFLRNQIDYAESLYSTLVLFGFTQPFSAFCDDILQAGEVRWREWIFPFCYDKFVGDLETFGNVEVIARSYDRPATGSPVLEFLSAVGLAPQRYGGNELPHDNLRPDLADCIRHYWRNRAGYSLDDRDFEAFLAPFRQARAGWPTMSSACRARFATAFDERNRRLCERLRLPLLELTARGEATAGPPLDEIFSSDTAMKFAVKAEPNRQR